MMRVYGYECTRGTVFAIIQYHKHGKVISEAGKTIIDLLLSGF